MKNTIIACLMAACLFLPAEGTAQKKKNSKNTEEYRFTELISIPTSSVKNQSRTGTCWSFATTSFIETELLRMGKPEYDLSEMFFVYHTYIDKAGLYVRYHGTNNFGPGGQAHDVINVIREYGFVPENAYPGREYGSETHNHRELGAVLKGFLEGLVKGGVRELTPAWPSAFMAVLETYLGKYPESFEIDGKTYTPVSFAESAGFDPDDYIEITSYSHHPWFEKICLEVPDNWSGDYYYNLPMDEMMEVINNALENGYSVAWDGDVSEGTFSHRNMLAILPEKDWESKSEQEREQTFKVPEKEKEVSQEMRQQSFDNYTTTDDHLMHLTGIEVDQDGKRYYMTKNSWVRMATT